MCDAPALTRAPARAVAAALLSTALLTGSAGIAVADDSQFYTTKVAKLSDLDDLVKAAPKEHDCVSVAPSIASARSCVLPPAPGRLLPTWAAPDGDAPRGSVGKLAQYKGVLLGFLGSLVSIERDERVCVNGANRLNDIRDCEDEANRKTIYVGTLGGSAMQYVLLQ